MRLDPENLDVQSFSTSTGTDSKLTYPYDTGINGPDSLCHICYETGNFVPSCNTYECREPDTGKGGPDSWCYICYETGQTQCFPCTYEGC